MNAKEKLQEAYNKYWDEIDEIAKKEFYSLVVPYCQICKIDFLAGMGTWGFFFTEHTDKAFREVKRFLNNILN